MVRVRMRVSFVLLAALLTSAGCSRKGPAHTPDPTDERLLQLGTAYLNATTRLKRPPKNFEELKPHLEGNVTEDFLRSPGDGEPFEVLWGVDFSKLPPRPDDPFTVAAYEKRGTGGKRHVLRFPKSVASVTDDELRKAVFPPGQKPPA